MNSKDGCCIISDEHFGHLFVLSAVMFNQPLFFIINIVFLYALSYFNSCLNPEDVDPMHRWIGIILSRTYITQYPNIRDCVKIGRMAKSIEEPVNFTVDTFLRVI